MKKLTLFALLFAVVTVFAGNFEAEYQKVEKWISETFTETNPSFRQQHNILRRIRDTKGSDEEKIAALHSKFPQAFSEGWKSELAAAKQQGITFSSDNKTLLKCPKNVTSVVIPSCVKIIGKQAFYQCENLTSVTIPESVVIIGEAAFRGCKNLPGITIPDSVTVIGDRAFCDCLYLTGITIPDGVTTIGVGTFVFCKNLINITIPNSVTTIGNLAFNGCEKLTGITLPDRVTTIGEGAFQKVPKVQVSSGNTVFKVDDSGALLDMKNNHLLYLPPEFQGEYVVPAGITAIGKGAFYWCKNLTGVTIPDTVTTIGIMAFEGCKNLTGITLPDSVTTIGGWAFMECGNLTGITIPGRVTTIGTGTFVGCKNLTAITIPDGVTTIGGRAFNGCEKLTVLTLPASVTTIGEGAFWKVPKIQVSSGNTVFTVDDSGALLNMKNKRLLYLPPEFQGEYVIPDGITTIGEGAFYECKKLTGVTIPDSVKTIGLWAFRGCQNLTGVMIPAGCEVGKNAFPHWCQVTLRKNPSGFDVPLCGGCLGCFLGRRSLSVR